MLNNKFIRHIFSSNKLQISIVLILLFISAIVFLCLSIPKQYQQINNLNAKKKSLEKEFAHRKPKRPPTPGQEQAIILEGIVINNDSFVCLINGQLLSVGDSILDYKIIGIEKNKVILIHLKTNEEKIFSLNTDDIIL